jgi:hypothetical protein
VLTSGGSNKRRHAKSVCKTTSTCIRQPRLRWECQMGQRQGLEAKTAPHQILCWFIYETLARRLAKRRKPLDICSRVGDGEAIKSDTGLEGREVLEIEADRATKVIPMSVVCADLDPVEKQREL